MENESKSFSAAVTLLNIKPVVIKGAASTMNMSLFNTYRKSFPDALVS